VEKLVEVLREIHYKSPEIRAFAAQFRPQPPQLSQKPCTTRSELSRYSVDRLLAIFGIGTHPETLVTVSRDHDGIDASVDVELGTNKESSLRAFLSHHGLQAPPVESNLPEVFTPGLPVYQSFTISPHSADAATISNLVAAFFQEIVGLNGSSELWFSSFEIGDE